MKKLFCILSLAIVSCTNKDLSLTDPCLNNTLDVKVVVNWENPAKESRDMRMTLFSESVGIPHHDRDYINANGIKYIKLPYGAKYLPLCYDYNANNVYFRNELDVDNIEAYCVVSSRSTYDKYGNPIKEQSTVSEPGEFYAHSWKNDRFNVLPVEGQDPLVLNFYPKNILREFTYRINNVVGADNIADARGVISGMSASYYLTKEIISNLPATILFSEANVSAEKIGYITGKFHTFGPTDPYDNRLTIEVMSKSSKYLSGSWDVSDQIEESMEDREAKLQRDGYDILINNESELPEIPGTEEPGSGFDIDVEEWDNVIIYL